MLLPEPSCFGLPSKFTHWRQYQDEAIWAAHHTDKRFFTTVAAVGSGKSLNYVTNAILNGGRAVILTSTKSLQTQLMKDFACIGMVDLRGRNSYTCRIERDGTTCDHGICISGKKCDLKKGGCDYYDAMRAARSANLVVTNYACWMTHLEYQDGLGDVDMLICDEAHDTPNMLDSFLTIELSRKNRFINDLLPSGDLEHLTIEDWKSWAVVHMEDVNDEVEWLLAQILRGSNRAGRRQLSYMKALQNKMKTIMEMDEEWIVESDEYAVRFSPVWPAAYAEEKLFDNIDKVIMTSGSVRPKTLDILGIDSEDNEIVEYPHTFPVANRRLYHIPTIRLNQFTTEDQLKVLTVRVDQIIRNRLDRKGIIHTVSYARQKFIIDHSEYRHYLLSNRRGNIESTLNEFTLSTPPLVLISPSISTGIDLPYDDCRYQIILKVPYPSTQGALMEARRDRDPGYPAYIAAQQLTQAYGRTTRAPDDFSETFIIDDNVQWFLQRHADYVPQYIHEAFSSITHVPSAPSLLNLNGGSPQ